VFFPAPYTAALPSSAAGDSNVPAGEVTWRAAAAALPTPWPEQEAQMVNLRQQMVAATAESAAHLAGMLVSWWDDDSLDPCLLLCGGPSHACTAPTCFAVQLVVVCSGSASSTDQAIAFVLSLTTSSSCFCTQQSACFCTQQRFKQRTMQQALPAGSGIAAQ
jgi:hypothetical protein